MQLNEKNLQDFGLPKITNEKKQTVEGLVNTASTIIQEEMEYDITELKKMWTQLLKSLLKNNRAYMKP